MMVKIGMIGLGERGKVLCASLGQIAGIEVAAICDTYDFRVEEGTALCAKYGWRPWAGRDYRELLKQDLDAVIITTTWTTHTRIAADAMRAGKHVGLEVGGAACEQECWELVRVSEETGKFCMLLENCCYADNELMLFHMAKQGLFGEIVHTAGGYEHDLREQIVTGLERKHGRMRNLLCRQPAAVIGVRCLQGQRLAGLGQTQQSVSGRTGFILESGRYCHHHFKMCQWGNDYADAWLQVAQTLFPQRQNSGNPGRMGRRCRRHLH